MCVWQKCKFELKFLAKNTFSHFLSHFPTLYRISETWRGRRKMRPDPNLVRNRSNSLWCQPKVKICNLVLFTVIYTRDALFSITSLCKLTHNIAALVQHVCHQQCCMHVFFESCTLLVNKMGQCRCCDSTLRWQQYQMTSMALRNITKLKYLLVYHYTIK